MAVTDFQSSYNAGEISPRLYARSDLAKFESGAALIRNYLVDYRGGVTFRPGTEFTVEVKDSGTLGYVLPGHGPRLLPFVVGTDAGYLLEFGDLYVRAYRLGVLVDEVTTPYLLADLALLKYAQSADVMTLTHASYPPANLTRDSDTSFSYAVLATGPAIDPPIITNVTATNGGNYFYGYLVTAVDIDGKEESLPSNIGVDTSEILDETSGKMVRLEWTAPSQATSRYNIYKWGPIEKSNNPQTVWGFIGSSQTTQFEDNNIAPDFSKEPPNWGDPFAGGQLQTVNINASGSGYVQGDDGWSHIPFVPLVITGDGSGATGYSTIRSSDSGKTTGAFLTNTGSGYTTVSITANGEGGTGATFTTVLSDPAPLYPACVAYYQQRRCFGGADLKPETLILSQTGLYNNFDITPVSLDTDAIAISLASLEVNTIKALVPVNYGLLVFTTGSVFLVNGGQPYAPVTPASITSQVQVSNGANDVPPLRINYDALYIQNKGNKVRSLSFAWQKQTYTGSDITSLCPHLFDGFNVKEWAYAEEPFKVIWAARDDGVMVACTYVPDQEVFAWTRHDTQGQFLSVASIPEGDENAVYVIAQRYVPGPSPDCGDGWVQYIERLQPSQCCIYESWFLDSALALPHTDGTLDVNLTPTTDTSGTLCFSGGTVDQVLRGPSVSYHFPPNNTLAATHFWFNFNIPDDYVSGDPITFNFLTGVKAETVDPVSMFCFINGAIITIDGGPIDAGTYSSSGHSYAVDSVRTQYTFNDSAHINAVTEGTLLHFASDDTIVSTAVLADGTAAGYPGEGMYSYAGGTILHGPMGWFPALESTAGTVTGTQFSPGDPVSVYIELWCESDDFANPSTVIYPYIREISYTYGATTTPVPFSSIYSGFNDGGTEVVTTEGAQDYPAFGPPTTTEPDPSTYVSTPWLADSPIAPTTPTTGDTILVDCAIITLGAQAENGDFAYTLVGEIDRWLVRDDPGGLVATIPSASWTWVTPTDTVSGLDHLEGKEVQALVDGRVVKGLTVASGAVTLPFVGSNVVVGLAYSGQIMNLYLTVEGLGRNTDQGKRKQVSGVTMRMDCSRGTYLGIAVDGVFPSVDDMVIPDELLFQPADPGFLYTGDARALTHPQWDRKAQVCILQQDPLPSTVLGVVVEVTGGDTGN